MAFVDVTIQGGDVTTKALERVYEALSEGSLLTFMETAAEAVYIDSMKERFAGEHGPDGKDWKELSERRKADRGDGGHPILVDTTELIRWMTDGGDASVFPSGAQMMFPKSGMGQELKEKFTTNQFGSLPGRVPARPFLGWNAEDFVKISAALAAWFKGASGLDFS